jgi:formimidoylglutamate deiminase
MEGALLPDLIFSGGRVRIGEALSFANGQVTGVGPAPAGAERLPRTAILPGLVSAHSHAFQRAIRGRTEHRGGHAEPSFWGWRGAMYSAAERLSPDDVVRVSRMCFLEMARTGITAVGEFHYLHRDPEGRPYSDPNLLSREVIRAAREVGLRIALLRVAYRRAGFQASEDRRQRRFIEPLEEYLTNLRGLAAAVRADPLVSVGAAPHSVRACPAPDIEAIAGEAGARGWPLHLHVAEQPAEVEQCRAEYGLTPVQLLDRVGALGERTTAVHAVHLTPDDVALLGKARATVCACPTTERDLGDGTVPADALLGAGARISLGTDSQVEIAPLGDARALEHHLRLARLERAVLDDGGEVQGLGARLYGFASAGGMRSLGIAGGALAPGEPADFVVVDLDDPSIVGAGADDLMAAVVFSMERTAVRDVYVAGEQVVQGREVRVPGVPGGAATVVREFREAMGRLWGGLR